MHLAIIDATARLQHLPAFAVRDGVQHPLQQAVQSQVVGGHHHGQPGGWHPGWRDHLQLGMLTQMLQADQGRQVCQIGIRQPALHHEGRLVDTVGLAVILHPEPDQLIAGPKAPYAHPTPAPRVVQSGLGLGARKQYPPRHPHDIQRLQRLLLRFLLRYHPQQQIGFTIVQRLLGAGIIGITPVLQRQSQLARHQLGKIVKGTAEPTPAIGIDIGGPIHRRHAHHQLAARLEPGLLRPGQVVVTQCGGSSRHQAPAGEPAQQDETIATAQHNELPYEQGGDHRVFG
ncbi:hypothetical protein D3C79_603100 [compost metagenome]